MSETAPTSSEGALQETNSQYRQAKPPRQQPLLALLKRLAPEPRLVLHLHPVPRYNPREHRDALRLREPAPDARARAPAERQERVAVVVVPEEARGAERRGVVPVVRVLVEGRDAERDERAGGDGERARLAGGGGGEREGGVFCGLFGDADDGGEEAEGLVHYAVVGGG